MNREIVSFVNIKSDLTPLDMYTRIRENFEYTFILESMEGPEKFATQSVLGFAPAAIFEIRDNAIFRDNKKIAKGFDNITAELELIIKQYGGKTTHNNQFIGGLVGFTSYDIIRSIEQLPNNNTKSQFPDAMYGLYLDGIRFNHKNQTLQYFHHKKADNRLEKLISIFHQERPELEKFRVISQENSFDRQEFENAVETIQNGIKAGETFQTVLSQRIDFEIEGDHLFVYQKLREINPSPYMYYLEFNPYFIIGSSPELLVSTEKNIVTTYPIAGTRPLTQSNEKNKELEKELLSDEKERAEHNMLVDLARNDIGTVSQFNSVKVIEYMTIEYFSHVMHIVSKVQGKIRDDFTMFDAFFKTFPAGTVSGAPKIRSMEIIEQLEPVRRGPYAGAVGYFSFNNESVQAITIRTAFGIDKEFSIQAGAGIVLDSVPAKEYEETLHKLGALLQVLNN